MDDGDIMCHPILVLSFLQDFEVANARVGAERNPLKTEVSYCVDDLDAAPLEWSIGDVRSIAKVSTVTAGSITLGVAVGPRKYIADQLLCIAVVIRALHERVQPCQNPRRNLPSSRSVWESAASTTSCEFTATQSFRNSGLHEVGQRSLERLFPGLSEGSMTQATLSAGQSRMVYKRRETSLLLHTWELS